MISAVGFRTGGQVGAGEWGGVFGSGWTSGCDPTPGPQDYSSLVTEESPNQVAIWSVTVKRLGSTCPFEWKHLLGEQSLFLLWNPPG